MTQDAVFLAGEGDAWFQRNQDVLGVNPEADWPLRMIKRNGIHPKQAYEIGCANGWRLAIIQDRYGASVAGCDPSLEAITDGQRRWPEVSLQTSPAHQLISTTPRGWADLVIVYFVLHWVSRETLFSTLAAVDRILAEGGHLVLGDFLPSAPTKMPYHHRDGVWTYKLNYSRLFLDTGCYQIRDQVVFDHETGHEGGANEYSSAACFLLTKHDGYRRG
jgi:SAM-dependent methyltransferase